MNRTSITLLGAALTVLALAACGSSSSSSSSSGAAGSPAGASTTTRTKFAACLKSHGVTLPHRVGTRHGYGSGGGGASGFFGGGPPSAPGTHRIGANPKFQAAIRACGASLPRHRFNPAARKTTIESFVSCVRKHGYDLPQPNFSGHGSVFPAKIATNAKFRTASRSCLSALRGPGGGPGGFGGGAGAPGAAPPPTS